MKRIFLALVLASLSVALWFLGRTDPAASVARGPQSKEASVAESKEAAPAPAPETIQPDVSKSVVPDKAPAPVAEVAMRPEKQALWEIKIDEALTSNAETPAIAQMLLQQVNGMPGDGQAAAARHIANLMPDKDYLSVLPYVQNTRLDPGFQEVIVAESLNRADEVKLPVLLAAARSPNHPMAEIAKTTLGFLLENDFGEDWGRWEAAVKEALAKLGGG
ncbi:MAG: hypothetical protein WCL08_09385 [Verrucomicrobiota bacterium]